MAQAARQRIGIIGKGALGLLYASVVDATLGPGSAVFVMDAARRDRHARDAFTVNGQPVAFRDATPEEAGTCDLVLVAVKSTGLPAALDLLEPLLGPDTPVVSVMNGITSEEKIAARVGADRVAPCVAWAMDAARYGCALEYSRQGFLTLGSYGPFSPATADRACAILAACGVDARLVDDVRHRMWAKFMANVGVNQVSHAFDVTYAELLADETSDAFRTYVGAMREVMAVARAEGVELTEEDLNRNVAILRTLDPASRPSMGQDRVNRNPSEVDEFSGEVVRRAERHGVLVPCNRYLNARVRAIESAWIN